MTNKPTFADKLTLDEVAENDLEMTLEAIKGANKFHFGNNMQKAVLFVRSCLDNTLRYLGIVISLPQSKEARERYAKKLDKLMEEKQIRIESRNKYRGQDQWRCGIYVYCRDELAAFISDVFTERRDHVDPISMKISKSDIGYMVITNTRTDSGQRIFTPSIVKRNGKIIGGY